jgi:hypothetical protein
MHTVHAGEVIALEEIPLTLILDCERHENDFFSTFAIVRPMLLIWLDCCSPESTIQAYQ